ncbi:MAG TPA: M15 family metallopeptidase [Actinomycetota bacterium]|nr:M15 family metallopeptidase [Actinomycetota bacterium]
MRGRRIGGVLAGGIVGLGVGVLATLALQGTAAVPEHAPRPLAEPSPFTIPLRPDTFLAWVPGGMPPSAAATLERMGARRVVVVASDNTWLTGSFDAEGEVVDDPPHSFAIPLEVAAVDPDRYAPFLPPGDRSLVVALARGQGVLGEMSAKLRGLGAGATMRFGDVEIEIAAVLPDELVGAHELLVSRETGLRIGVTHDRYALLVPRGEPDTRALTRLIRGAFPPGTLVRVRAPGDTPYFRHGDAVLPPVEIKRLFGEFTAKPSPGQPGFLTVDDAWADANIDTRRVPVLGTVTCNVALFPQLEGAMRELQDRGLDRTIRTYSGCYSARHINRIPTAGLSHHSWGIAIDVNVRWNAFGTEPDQDPRLVTVMERWGFTWGGDWVLPDGMHFEYRRPPSG